MRGVLLKISKRAPPNDHYTPIPEILIQSVSAEVKPWFCCSVLSLFSLRGSAGVSGLRTDALGEGECTNTPIFEAIRPAPTVP